MKHLRVLMVLILVVAMLTACGSKPVETAAPTTAPTTVPTTEAPTEAPTTAPTEAPLDPIVNYCFDEPEGFTTISTTDTLQILAGPDSDGSSITIMLLETAMDFAELNEETFAASLGLLGDDGSAPTLNAIETTEIDGYPACLVDYNMTPSGIPARYTTYYVTDRASTVAFIFADATADGAWAEAFAASAASINLLTEGEFVPADTTGLELYDLGCGVSMYAVPGLEALEIEGYAAVLAGETCTIMVIQDNKEEYGLYGLTVEDYVSFYVDGETITGFETDGYGNTATAFLSQGDDGVTYFYYGAAKNTADNFYFIQLACDQNAAMSMSGEFAQWCATFAENP